MIKLLIFDFDGTISDTRDLACEITEKVLIKNGYGYEREKIMKLAGTKMEYLFSKIGIPKNKVNKLKKEFYEEMVKNAGRLKLCSSIKPIRKLKKKYRMIVISNAESSLIKASSKKLHVNKLFEKFYCADNFSSKDVMIKKILKKYGIKGNEAVYIGDRFSDVEYSRKAGCIAISIHNKCSFSSLKSILKENPDFIIADFSDLYKFLKMLNSY